MSATLPARLALLPGFEGLDRQHQGKVRDTYLLPHHSDHRLPYATDRISIFDFVLDALVPQKGEILNALSIFWRIRILSDFAHDLAAYGAAIDEWLPTHLRGNLELQCRAVVVQRLDMIPVEAIVRRYLTGSGLTAYRDTGMVCGHKLRGGLTDGSRLDRSLFTPTTKAEIGHDEHITAESVDKKYGNELGMLARLISDAVGAYAETHGVLLADTKLEFGWGRDKHGQRRLMVGDEIATPDSSRLWKRRQWLAAMSRGKAPTSFDKQVVRELGKLAGLHKLDPKLPEHVAQAHAFILPGEAIAQTKSIYRYIFWVLTGFKLEDFQRDMMGVAVKRAPVTIDVVVGSESDLPQVDRGLEVLANWARESGCQGSVNIISCHRNPAELANYVRDLKPEGRVVIAGAGKAAALPGVLNALLVAAGKSVPVIGVGFTGTTPSASMAAQLSISELPEQPVYMDKDSRPYVGATGFHQACQDAINFEYLPEQPESRPAKVGLSLSEALALARA